MKIQKFCIFFILVGYWAVHAQIMVMEYQVVERNKFINQDIISPATLYTDGKSVELYTVQFNTSLIDKNKLPSNVILGKPFEYQLYANNSTNSFIVDRIDGRMIYFKDHYNIIWRLSDGEKVINNRGLRRATTNFRGRDYTIWYDPNVKTFFGPWKFNNAPGLIYEAEDNSGTYRWKLISYKLENKTISDPFASIPSEKWISYKEYPSLRYGLSEELKKALQQNPNNQIFEQPRNGIETKFEWEQQ